MTDPTLNLTDSAATQIAALRDKEGKPDLMLRVTVHGGGCSGFKYELGYEDTVNADDFVFENKGAKVVTDATSMEFLEGCEIDYESTMLKSAFKLNIPKAAGSCGCGKSFSVKN